jgi:hypothetical protein
MRHFLFSLELRTLFVLPVKDLLFISLAALVGLHPYVHLPLSLLLLFPIILLHRHPYSQLFIFPLYSVLPA